MFGFITNAMRASFNSLFSGLMANIASLPKPVPWRSRGKGRGFNNGLLSLHRSISRQSNPAGPRKWHDPASLEQGFRMLAAQTRRERRGAKLQGAYDHGQANNPCLS